MSDRRRTAKDLADRARNKIIPGHVAYGRITDHAGDYTNPHEVKLEQLEDVSLASLVTGQSLEYDSVTGFWYNVNIPRKTQSRMYFFSSF